MTFATFVNSRWHPTYRLDTQSGCSVWIQHGVWPMGQHPNLLISAWLLRGQQSMTWCDTFPRPYQFKCCLWRLVKTPCTVIFQDDTTFTIGLKLQMYRHSPSDVVSHDVTQTCSYTRWASNEILCERNYMEVSYSTFMLVCLFWGVGYKLIFFLFCF